jgi:hypothetical protein
MAPRVMKARKPASARPAPRVAKRRPPLEAVPPEHSLQVVVADYLDVALKGVCPWTSIDAGQGKMTKRAAGMRKRRGVKAGWPDVQVLWQGRYHGIELKRERYGKLSDEQEALLPWIRASGGLVAVCHSVDEVCAALTGWGIPVRVSLARLQGRVA